MEKLIQDVQSLTGLHLTSRQAQMFKRFEDELIDWNSRMNLTAIRDVESIRMKHFLDSLSCVLAFRDTPATRIIDIGTGAGFPGIPLKIVNPAIQLTLVESVGKKADFCRHIINVLGLTQVDVFNCRAEEIGQMAQHRQRYDWAVARAVAGLPVLVEFLLPLVKVGGHALAQKGETGPAEAHQANHPLQLLGGAIQQLIPVMIPGVSEDRYLVVMSKQAATPPQYPRRVGLPAKNPLQ
jgi:16S rRNA (guanine527-N7)-methyltransferase